MKKVIFWSSLTALFLCLLQTAILSHIKILPALPDLVLILVVYIAVSNGSSTGLVAGFIAGLFLDFLSMAPMGLHALIFTILAYFLGKLYGKYNISKIIFPVFFLIFAVMFKAGMYFVLAFLFGKNIQVYDFRALTLWIELGITIVFAPIVFAILNMFSVAFKTKEF